MTSLLQLYNGIFYFLWCHRLLMTSFITSERECKRHIDDIIVWRQHWRELNNVIHDLRRPDNKPIEEHIEMNQSYSRYGIGLTNWVVM